MYPKVIDPVQRRNTLLGIAAACLVLAIIQRPALLLFFMSARITINLVLTAVAALFMAMAIREFALAFLCGPGDPWYAKPGAIVFLAFGLCALNAFLTTLIMIGPMADTLGLMLRQPGMRFQLTAFEVFWIVVLEWVSYAKD